MAWGREGWALCRPDTVPSPSGSMKCVHMQRKAGGVMAGPSAGPSKGAPSAFEMAFISSRLSQRRSLLSHRGPLTRRGAGERERQTHTHIKAHTQAPMENSH